MNSRHLRRAACLAALASLTACFGGAAQKARPEAQSRAETLLIRGIRAEQRGNAREAEKLLLESLAVSSSIEDETAKALSNINLARLYRLQHDMVRARGSIDAALGMLGNGADIYAEAAFEKALIELQADSGVALLWAEKSVAAGKGTLLGRCLNLLGRIQLARGDLKGSASTLQKALAENRENGLAEEEANSLRMLGIMARGEHRMAEAEGVLAEALEIDKRTGVSVKIATDLEELATTARMADNLEKAARYLERAYDVHLSNGRLRKAGENQAVMADLFDRLGEGRKAETARKIAQKIAGEVKDQSRDSSETIKPSRSP